MVDAGVEQRDCHAAVCPALDADSAGPPNATESSAPRTAAGYAARTGRRYDRGRARAQAQHGSTDAAKPFSTRTQDCPDRPARRDQRPAIARC
jgi:hypothetical protein